MAKFTKDQLNPQTLEGTKMMLRSLESFAKSKPKNGVAYRKENGKWVEASQASPGNSPSKAMVRDLFSTYSSMMPTYEAKNKVVNALVTRGYSKETVEAVLKDIRK